MNLIGIVVFALIFSVGFLPVQALGSERTLRFAGLLGAVLGLAGIARLVLGPFGLDQLGNLLVFGVLAFLGLSIVIGWLVRRSLLARVADSARRRRATAVTWLVLSLLFGAAVHFLWAAA